MEKLHQGFKGNKIVVIEENQRPQVVFIEAPSPLREHKIVNGKTSFCISRVQAWVYFKAHSASLGTSDLMLFQNTARLSGIPPDTLTVGWPNQISKCNE